MVLKKILLPLICIFLLAVFQASFMAHFSAVGQILNFVLIAVILWNFFESEKNLTGLFYAFAGGLFLDMFSERIIGFYVLMFVATSLLLKLIVRKYVRIPFLEKA